ncbi:hypothetical protein [Chitinophaga varians]|nr:hypothetical protein [Chitinophaga varians]MBC9913541.1 hypothetical protein [Chitinophaga varians]
MGASFLWWAASVEGSYYTNELTDFYLSNDKSALICPAVFSSGATR